MTATTSQPAVPFFGVNGSRVVSGSLTIPFYGTWVADLVLAVSDSFSPGMAVTVVLGGLSLKGTVARSAGFSGARTMRIIGGGAGWRKVIAAKGYSHDAGIKLSTVLQDAASAAGEKIAVATDTVIGTEYARRNDLAERVLKHLINGQWWMGLDGVTQTKARSNAAIVTPFTIESYSGGKGKFDIASESYQDWMPGRSFSNAVVTDVQTISSVSFVAQDGKIDISVTNTLTGEERLLQHVRSMVRAELSRNQYAAIVEYTITNASSMKIDCDPVNPGWPTLAGVPLKASILGETVTPTVGAKALIAFLNSDPTQFRCVGVEGMTVQTSFGTTGDVAITVGGIVKVNGASDFVALAQKVLSEAVAHYNWDLSHVHPTGVGPSGPPAAPPPSPNSTACTKLRTD